MAVMMEGEPEAYEGTAVFQADAAAITEAMRAERTSSRYDPRVLHETVRMAALHARLHQCPPERLVRALKALVREISMDDNTEAHRLIYTDRIIAWAIESYYELAER
ncbi:MAG: hypothetical protein ABI889_05615 [Gemmatimonadota bacterium]